MAKIPNQETFKNQPQTVGLLEHPTKINIKLISRDISTTHVTLMEKQTPDKDYKSYVDLIHHNGESLDITNE